MDADQTASKERCDQGLHYLSFSVYLLGALIKKACTPTAKKRSGRLDKKGLYTNFQEREWIVHIFEPCYEKTCLMPNANNKGADQPVGPCSLISDFVFHCLESIIPLDGIFKISRS